MPERTPSEVASGEPARGPKAGEGRGGPGIGLPPSRRRVQGGQVPWWGRYGVVLTTALLIVILALTTPNFATLENFQIVSGSNSIAAMVALGALVPLIIGEFDLSVGAQLEFSSVLVAVLVGQHDWPLAQAAAIAILATTTIGILNGVLIAFLRVGSFIATLASGSVVAGMSLYLTDGQVLFEGIPETVKDLSQGLLGPIPNLLVVAAVVTLALWYVAERTPAGRQMVSIGLNKEAAQLMGIPDRRLTVIAFAIAGLLSGIAGFLLLGRVGSASSGIGASFLLPALAAGFLGATTIKLGRFNVFGTIMAVILVAVGLNGLSLNGAPAWVEPVFNGVVLAIAVSASRFAILRAAR